MASRTDEHLQEVNPQRGTRRRSQASDVNGKKNPSLSYNPIINGTLLHDYAFTGALSSSSTISINNPTNIYNSSERAAVPVGSTSGAPQPGGAVHGTQAATNMNTSASMDIPILSAQPQLQAQPTPTMNPTAYTDIPMLSAQPQPQLQTQPTPTMNPTAYTDIPMLSAQPQPSYHGGWSPPMQMDGFDLSPFQTQHPSAMQHANASRRTTGEVNMNHASFEDKLCL